jgi:serine/threonine-protein kinase
MYASAHTGLAEAHLILFSWDQLTLDEIKPVVESSLDRALALDPLQGEAHTVLALYLTNLARYEEAEREWKTAIELMPGQANAHHWFGIMLWEVGRFDDSRAQLRRALVLDPLSRIINTNVGLGEYFARNYEAAVAQYQRALERFPDFSYSWILLAMAYSLNGQHEEAVQAARRSLEISPGDKNYTQMLAVVLARAGDEEEARRLMVSVSDSDPTRYALVHAALGDTDEVFRWLDVALDEGSPFLTELGVEPAYDPIRADPRFQAAMSRVGLE